MIIQAQTCCQEPRRHAVEAATLGLGAICLAAVAAGTTYQPGSSYIFDAAGLAITATALIFTAAVIVSRAMRSG